MRRFQALLIVAGLVAAPSGAAAGPSDDRDADRTVETWKWQWSVGKGRLGAMVIGLTPELREHFGASKTSGVLVGAVEPGSPAAKAGLRVGDVIVETNGRLVDDAGDIREAIAGAKKGDAVELEIVRERKAMTLDATLLESAPRSMLDASWLRDLMQSFEPRGAKPAPART